MKIRILRLAGFAFSALAIGSAFGQADKTLGTRKSPLKLAMVPSSDATKILNNMAPVSKCLEKETGYFFDISVPNNYVVVVEGLGSSKVDVAFLNTFGYLLANDRYGSEALLKVSRNGETTYRGVIFVKSDSKIQKIEDLTGKKIAFVDPASTSGHILPKKLMNDKKVKPAEEVFAGKHDVAVTMLYQGQVDAAAAYYNAPAPDGKPRDAREKLLAQFPDTMQKIKVLELTEEIPNDPIVVRKDISAEMKGKIKVAFQKCVASNVEAFKGINNSDALAPVVDKDYDGLRKTVQDLKIDLGGELSKKK